MVKTTIILHKTGIRRNWILLSNYLKDRLALLFDEELFFMIFKPFSLLQIDVH